jgi:hypothetical protein
MGKTHEALLRAEEEYQEDFFRPLREPLAKDMSPVIKRASNGRDIEWYEALKTNLFSRYSDGAIKRILFNGTFHGGGCSTTAVNFAIALAEAVA